jgi:hypothetical protein
LANLQAQLHQRELRHNQELAIALRGINMNTRQIGVITQQLANPPIDPQQPEISNGSDESRLSSTFQSTASNDPPSAPLALALSPVRTILDAHIHQSEVNSAAQQAEPQDALLSFWLVFSS